MCPLYPITAILAAATGALATPLNKRDDPPVAPNAQACIVKQGWSFTHGNHNNYHVEIGVAFNAGAGCSSVEVGLTAIVMVYGFRCEDNGFGGTVLAWSGLGEGVGINESLEKSYPMVNGFNCPDW